jgi:hypothetical protein
METELPCAKRFDLYPKALQQRADGTNIHQRRDIDKFTWTISE